ncbi:hypothetical protein Gohar_018979 [Gossypium harknessii]|uniref:Uncharacterized protein n=1 Tax=Gossypium harknessii TaxID=34285 RepID=A0A7J9GB17_9ROSI|nr:hypothetical protein [Gossypium harknessii]
MSIVNYVIGFGIDIKTHQGCLDGAPMSNRWFGLPHPPGQIRLLYGPTHSSICLIDHELTQYPVLPLPSLDSLLQHNSPTIINPHRSISSYP